MNINAFDFNKIEDVKLRVDLATSIYKANERIAKKFNIESDLDNPSAEFINTIADELKKEGEKILRMSSENFVGPTIKTSRINNLTSKVQWKKLARLMVTKLSTLRTYIRKQGFFYLGYALFTNILQFTIPSLLVAANMNILGFAAFYILSDLPAYLYYKVAHSIYYKHKMFRLFGGKEKYLKFKKIDVEVKSILKLSDHSDMLLPIQTDSGAESIVLKEDKFYRKLLKRFGYKDDGLTLSQVTKFINDENINTGLIKAIVDNERLPEMMKLSMLTLEIQRSSPASVQTAFLTKFNDYFVGVKDTSSMEEVYQWVNKILKTEDLDELVEQATNMPKSFKSSEQFVILWQEVILPRIADKKDMMSFNQYRKLSGTFQLFKVNIYKNELSLSSSEFQNHFEKYLSTSFGQAKVNCGEKIDLFIGTMVKKFKKGL